jgi:hypothetical protein
MLASLIHPVIEPVSDVVSPNVYSAILASPDLRQQIIPEGLAGSPYEILTYDATLTLDDPGGREATFQRVQQVRFLQDGVSAMLDHLWGDGVLLTHYRNSAGTIGESFKDAGRRHLVINLPRRMARGETLTFEVERRAAVGFTARHEWLETTIDHPIRQLTRTIIFPKERPCQAAHLAVEGKIQTLTPAPLSDGRTLVRVQISQPHADTPYTIYWTW